MGALHNGHLSLVDRAIKKSELSVVSIFINPKQFSEGEDLASYPITLDNDISMLRSTGLDVLFIPRKQSIYPDNFSTYVSESLLSRTHEGSSRPDFFRGVTTVVFKLFNIVRPSFAFFGKKDFQQLLVIEKMVRDLNYAIDIIRCDTVREPSGLAMSSRNNYFQKNSWNELGLIHSALLEAKDLIKKNPNDLLFVKRTLKKNLMDLTNVLPKPLKLMDPHAYPIKIDYVDVCEKDTLRTLEILNKKAIILIAVWVYGIRLIDNVEVSF